jgi:hypothetical protein
MTTLPAILLSAIVVSARFIVVPEEVLYSEAAAMCAEKGGSLAGLTLHNREEATKALRDHEVASAWVASRGSASAPNLYVRVPEHPSSNMGQVFVAKVDHYKVCHDKRSVLCWSDQKDDGEGRGLLSKQKAVAAEPSILDDIVNAVTSKFAEIKANPNPAMRAGYEPIW